MHRKHRILGLLAGAAMVLSATSATYAHAATSTPHAAFYLALGDSLSAGYQPDPTISWENGWVYQFRAMLAQREPTVLTNLALGGECTGTFINGGLSPACPTKTISSPAQLAVAVAYLKAYAGQVGLITVEVGGDNLYGHMTAFLKDTPAAQQALLQGLFPPLVRDWATIFTTLRRACPGCTIVAVNQYDPLPPTTTTAGVPMVMALYNGALVKITAPLHIKVADVYSPFVGHELTYTWIARGDIHPNTAGYTVMAHAVAKTIGLTP